MPRIFYLGHDHDRPNGGQKDTYQHVDVLNDNGFEAFVVHRTPGFRLGWFRNRTAVVDQREFQRLIDPARDFLVVPEDLGRALDELPGRKIIFNKNLYHGFGALAMTGPDRDPHLSDAVAAIFCVSRHNQQHLQYAYPGKPVYLVNYDLRLEIFRGRSLKDKQPLIACMPKAFPHVATLRGIAEARSAASGSRLGAFEWIYIHNMSEQQVARVLRRALVFVFLSLEEGLPRMPLEAMASGCLIAAYGHGPLRECLPAGYSFEHGDLVSVVRFLEQIAEAYPNLDRFQPLVRKGREQAQRFGHAGQVDSVLSAWRSVMGLQRHRVA